MSKELAIYRKQAGDLEGEAQQADEAIEEFRSLVIEYAGDVESVRQKDDPQSSNPPRTDRSGAGAFAAQ